MVRLHSLTAQLIDNLKDAKTPVLFWSSGSDSNLLLAALLESGKPFDIFQARDGWTKEQRRIPDELIKRYKLKVYSYPPQNFYFIGENEQISLVFEYAVGGLSFPHLRDVVEGTRCIAELGKIDKIQTAPIVWDLHIIGTRKDDAHFTTNGMQLIPSEKFEIHGVKFYAPLYEMSREDVKKGLAAFEFDNSEVKDTEDSGNLVVCSLCLRKSGTGQVFCPKEKSLIPVVDWIPEDNLHLFRQKFGFK